MYMYVNIKELCPMVGNMNWRKIIPYFLIKALVCSSSWSSFLKKCRVVSIGYLLVYLQKNGSCSISVGPALIAYTWLQVPLK